MPAVLSPSNRFNLTLAVEKGLDRTDPQRVDLVCNYITARAFEHMVSQVEVLNDPTADLDKKARAAAAIIELGLERISGAGLADAGYDDPDLLDIFNFAELMELTEAFINAQAGPSSDDKKKLEQPSESNMSESVKGAPATDARPKLKRTAAAV